MKTKELIFGLGALNVLLAVGLLAWHPSSDTPAQAQGFGGGAKYSLQAVQVVGRNEEAMLLTELSTGRTVATIFNGSSKKFEKIGGREIGEDLARGANGGGAGGGR